MAVELKVPESGESITEVQVGDWLKSEGDHVDRDESVVVLDTDKATLELPSPVEGVISEILRKKGETVKVGDVIGYVEENGAPAKGKKEEKKEEKGEKKEPEEEERKEKKEKEKGSEKKREEEEEKKERKKEEEPRVMPAARRLMEEKGISEADVEGSGPGGRILKEDVEKHLEGRKGKKEEEKEEKKPAGKPAAGGEDREEEEVPMSTLRRRVAARLVEAQQTAALLTTFNEIDMSGVISLRKENQEAFQEAHGIKLGFMSFFVKGAVEALKKFPQVNGEIRGDKIVYKNYYDIGIAVGGGKGLVVPVIRDAHRLSFAELEEKIADFAGRAQEGKLSIDELTGGTFTISNGGVYGSLLSTPIVNPPQSAILGMHAIQERPVVRDGQVVIRPMMYVAMTYDHRVIDGRESVNFLKAIKQAVENPSRILLEI